MSFETEEVNVILEPIFKESELEEPVAETFTEPVAESVAESVAETFTEPVAETFTEPVAETFTEPVADTFTEPVAETFTEPVTEKPVDVFEDNVIKNAKIIYTQTNMLSSIIDNTKKGHPMKNYKRPIPLLYKN